MTKQEMIKEMLQSLPKYWGYEETFKKMMKVKKEYIQTIYTHWLNDKEHSLFYIDLLTK